MAKAKSKLTQMMEFKGMSQTDAAKRLKVSQPAVSMVCARGLYNIPLAQRYAKILNCDKLAILELDDGK